MKNLAAILLMLIIAVSTSAQTVYVTKTGTKYHMAGCRYLSQSKIDIVLRDAIDRGYTPCSVCKPPIKDNVNKATEKVEAYKSESPQNKSEVNSNVTSAITVYITKSGTKYHKSGCTYLKNSRFAISLEDAKNQGYTSCSVCNPPG